MPKQSRAPRSPSLRILVVDDDRDTVVSTAILLREWGHEVATATSGIEALEQIDDVVEGAHEIHADFVVGQIPTAVLEHHLEDALPRFGVGRVDHAAKDPPVRGRAEDRGAENSIEMLVRVGVVPEDKLLRRPAEALANVHVEPAFPVTVAERRRRRCDRELVGHEVIVRH